ncbi:ABC transporter ATP-binding protein [Cytobacillus oceanisediminis]|uniref:ABC transporter ATP-binding protein n=1 Tax=Cytobacillus TaxID=2675230 RepID=UPI0001F45063|nr:MULTISPECIES: ABC transporter ATP-binding protein [Cytobacillus]EFV77450.1 hypothetical protein HMPREF1013_02411 [Bacillus sp. 2_A_57_CT2]QOK25189.1 ABC transporter ATP-binding protein [Cytobacillus oceanisediminis]
MDTLVEIQEVTKVIKGRTIIDSVSFEVKKGEVFGFLGPNGAGKTTTIRMLVGLIGITSGDIKILGSSIKTDFEKAVSHIGAIVENPEMYKFLSGYQNLVHYARMSKGITREKIDETVELVGLADRIHDKVRTYSLGMRQRLGLAQCLLHDPKILILDEPTNGLDPAGIREIRDHLRMLAREREMAVIVSSHLLSEMEMMCDRIGIIQNGKLIDVQHISDFVQGKEKVYEVEVDDPRKANGILQGAHPGLPVQLTETSVILSLVREDIPEMIKVFVQEDMKIFAVREVTKTLEDRFLEVTEYKGGAGDARTDSK